MKYPTYATKNANDGFMLTRGENYIVPIDKSLIFLSVNLKEIRNVGEWARQMGYSRSYFSRKIKQRFHKSPKKLLRSARLMAIVVAFLKDPYRKAFVIARETGFENEKSLGQFLSRNFEITINEVRHLCKLYSTPGPGTLKKRLNIILLQYLNGLTQNRKRGVYLFEKAQIEK